MTWAGQKKKRRKYDLVGAVRGYVTFLRRSVEQQGSGSSNATLKQRRVELLEVQKRNAELAYQQKSAELLPIDVVESLFMEAAAIFVGQKRSMGSRLAGKLAGMSDPQPILKLLNTENDKILAGVADKFSALADLGTASSES